MKVTKELLTKYKSIKLSKEKQDAVVRSTKSNKEVPVREVKQDKGLMGVWDEG